MASFNVNPLSRFSGASTSIRRPREIACFSFDDEHKLHALSESSLRYYHPPFFATPGDAGPSGHDIDLSRGFERFQNHDDQIDEHLDALLDTLVEHEQQAGEIVQTDVVTWRGMMTKILTAPFDRFSEFEMNATSYQGTIFIEESHTFKADNNRRSQDDAKRRQRPGQPSQAMMQYWGYKFETICVLKKSWAESSRDDIEGRDKQIVSNEAQYCSIVRTGIGGSSLIIGGEVDAVLGGKPMVREDPIPWVELKTSQQIRNEKDDVKFEAKLLKFWAQSFLLGVPKIIVGFRSPNGKLMEIEEFETQKIPSAVVRRGRQSWDGNVCINFTAAFLEFLKRTIRGDGVVWRIQRKERDDVIRLFELDAVKAESILKPSFTAHREQMQATLDQKG